MGPYASLTLMNDIHRWDGPFIPPFSSVSELMELAKSYLEVASLVHHHKLKLIKISLRLSIFFINIV